MTIKVEKDVAVVTDANRDPLTGEAGSHPVATGVGSAGGAAAGAGIGGVIGGPVGALVGGVIGAVAGGVTGHVAGEAIDPTLEAGYWRENYKTRPYFNASTPFESYEPAYRYGWETAAKPEYKNRKFEEVEADLARDWDKAKGASQHAWDKAKLAARDSWDRVRGRSK